LILFIEKCQRPIFICIKIQNDFAKHRKEEEVMNKKISGDYLDKINSGYLEYIKSQTELNVLIIDVSDKDFVKIKRLPFILNARIKLINYK
jgi:deoxyadenosine/deoxycytidine kinase